MNREQCEHAMTILYQLYIRQKYGIDAIVTKEDERHGKE